MSTTRSARTAVRQRQRQKPAVAFEVEDNEIQRIKLVESAREDLTIREAEQDAREFDAALPEYPLPGSGDSYEDCGDSMPLGHCERCGKPTYGGRTCGRSVCPRCWESWDRDRAVSIASQIEGLRRYKSASGNRKLKEHHLNISPPPGVRFNSKQPLEQAIRVVKALLQLVNVDTGVIIYHPYRIRKEHRGEVMGHDSGDGDLTWKDVIPKIERGEWSTVRNEYLEFAPHFHVIGLSNFVQGGAVTREIEEKTGWVINRITKRDSAVSIYDPYDLASVAGYCLSHAAVRETESGQNRAVVRRFGEVSNFSPTEGVRADVESAFNAVSDRVLGQSFGFGRCTGSEEEVGNAGSPGDGGEIPEWFDEDLCNGQLVPISTAPEYLGDAEWFDGAPYAQELAEAYAEWIEATAEGFG